MRAMFCGLVVIALGSSASAHIALRSPAPRTADQKAGPCGAAGSKRGQTVTPYAAGETITVEWDETVGHPGHYRIAFDDDGNDAFQNPSTPNDNFASTLADQIVDRDGTTHYTQTVTLPTTPCANCTLQLVQVMTTQVPYNSFYYQCADLTIGDAPRPATMTSVAAARRIRHRAGCARPRAGCLARSPEIDRSPEMIDALWRQVLAAPDDNELRAVLGDALLARGDSRGELIALQLQPASPARDARIDLLVEMHGVEWLGPLRGSANRAQFARGCVTRLELHDSLRPNHLLEPKLTEPLLATVEDLVAGRVHHNVYARFVTSSAMTALRRIEVLERETLIAFRKTRAAIQHVAIHAVDRRRYRVVDGTLVQAVLDICLRHPVTSIGFELGAIDLVLAHPVYAQLSGITVATRLTRAIPLVHQLRDTLAITIAPSPRLSPCIAGPLLTLGEARLSREAGRVTLRGWGQWFVDELVAAPLQGVHRIELAASASAAERVRQAIGDIELQVEPERSRLGYVRALSIRPKPR
ncbi:MAG: SCE4755 family polysaccharide monooxygenase-like protein [Kofleriaceae bacterium]